MNDYVVRLDVALEAANREDAEAAVRRAMAGFGHVGIVGVRQQPPRPQTPSSQPSQV